MTSVAGALLALLDEDDRALKAAAVRRLHGVVDSFWPEVADALPSIEALSEEPGFAEAQLAAAVASKCFYHLEAYDEALRLALVAGPYFNVDERSEYVSTIVGKCIDTYIARRLEQVSARDGGADIDPALVAVVERMFGRCFHDGEFNQAIGIAIESQRVDMVEAAVTADPSRTAALLSHVFDLAHSVVTTARFREELLAVLVRLYRSCGSPDVVNMCRCWLFLNDDKSVAETLDGLLSSPAEHDHLLAYQVAFDLVDSDNQSFLYSVYHALSVPAGASDSDAPSAASGVADRVTQLRSIIDGSLLSELHLDFLFRHNKSDAIVMKRIKAGVEGRTSVLHNAAVVAHGYMNAGTTVDTFLRDNLPWLAAATHWAKFTAAAGQGVIHRGHLKKSMALLEPYLPREGAANTVPYTEGGGLYALGLIHADHGWSGGGQTVEYLRNALRGTTHEVVQHGACLGLGLAAMSTGSDEVYTQLREVLFQDNAVAGEAAGLAIGLVLLGKGAAWHSEAVEEGVVEELLAYAHDSVHEKIIRGIAMALALIVYGHEERADGLIGQLTSDNDPILRYGGMYAIGLAYAGTARNGAVSRLLHVAVSDVSNDVRRAAVTCLGFVLFRSPESVPRLVALLAESYNPHVRYGACLAMGVACAGTGGGDAVVTLQKLAEDSVDFVRQGALMALGMVLMQESEARAPAVKTVRELFSKIVADKSHTTMTKVGAILGQGIIDAGGCNVTISLRSASGFKKTSAIVSVALWLQHWYWYPLYHMLSLAFVPTALIGVNKDLAVPSGFTATCAARPSLFAYPAPLVEKTEEKKGRVEAAVLSTAAVERRRRREKEKAKEKKDREEGKDAGGGAKDSDGDVSMSPAPPLVAVPSDLTVTTAGGGGADGAGEEKKADAVEPRSFTLTNPCRVTRAQQPYVRFRSDSRYVPVRRDVVKGVCVVVLEDSRPEEEEEVLSLVAHMPGDADANEPPPPEPFEWSPPS